MHLQHRHSNALESGWNSAALAPILRFVCSQTVNLKDSTNDKASF